MPKPTVFSPIKIIRKGESFQIRLGMRPGAVLHIYYSDDPEVRARKNLMNRDDAEMLAVLVARTLRAGIAGPR